MQSTKLDTRHFFLLKKTHRHSRKHAHTSTLRFSIYGVCYLFTVYKQTSSFFHACKTSTNTRRDGKNLRKVCVKLKRRTEQHFQRRRCCTGLTCYVIATTTDTIVIFLGIIEKLGKYVSGSKTNGVKVGQCARPKNPHN